MFELSRCHLNEIRTAIQTSDSVHACDELVLGEQRLEVHHGTDGFQVIGMIRDESVEFAKARHGIEICQHKGGEHVSFSADADKAGSDGLPRGHVCRGHVAVEGHDRRDFRRDGDQDLVDRPDRHLGDQPGVPILDLFFRPGQRVNLVAGRDVFIVAFHRDHRLWWQFVLHRHFPGIRPVQGPGPVRKALWIDRGVQYECAELRDGFRIAFQEIALERVHTRVVVLRGPDRSGGSLIINGTALG